jgi:signal transduction histidine kinase
MVAGFVQLLTDRVGQALDERGREYVAFALSGAERMDRMIDAILRYSRVGTHELTPTPVDPAKALQSALLNLRGALTESDGEVTFDELPPVLADEGLLILLFQNLVSNALKYRADAPPRVHVSASQTADRVVLSIRDNGVGVAPEHHEQIFQLFGRSDRRDGVPGSGIGLATCRRVAERLGGSIRVESEAGRGATFLVELPAATPTS